MTFAATRDFAPADSAGVADALRMCAKERLAVVVSGGDTLQSIGNAPARCDVRVRMTHLVRMCEYDPRDMTAGIEAGMTIAALEHTLGAAGQWLPLDVPHPARATIGGTLAAGWIGPRRAAYGRPRDLLIGSTVALADGTLARAGGMVAKNVTGYDMSKLYVGSLGTLGIFVRANFKTLPKPAERRLAIAAVAEEHRDRVVAALNALEIEPTAAAIIDGFYTIATCASAPCRVIALLEGTAAAVERGVRDLRSALGRAGVPETALHDGAIAERVFADFIDAYVENVDDRSLTYRCAGLPSNASRQARALATIAEDFALTAETIADLRTGDVILRLSARDRAEFARILVDVDAAVRAYSDRISVLAGSPALRASIDAWGPPPATIDTMRTLKSRFDPHGILAPGRYVGGI